MLPGKENTVPEKRYTIYCHTTPDGKKYIGATCQKLSRRWRNGESYKNCSRFAEAIEKIGWENIQHEVLEADLTREEADEKEREYIEKFHTTEANYGYNLQGGGRTNFTTSPVTLEKQRISQLARITDEFREAARERSKKYLETHKPSFKGHHHTEETKKILSELRKGKSGYQWSENQKQDISNRIKGKHKTQETKDKLREAHIGNADGSKNPRARKIKCVETGEVFACGEDAAKWIGAKKACNIITCCKGKLKSAYGYHWEYADLGEFKGTINYANEVQRQVVCLETGETFKNCIIASEWAGSVDTRHPGYSIVKNCLGLNTVSLGHHWKFLDCS